MELSLLQAAAVGTLAAVITQALRLIANRYGYVLNREQIYTGLFGVSLLTGLAFFGIPEVTGSDPLVVAESLISAAISIVGAAALSYNILVKKVLLPVE